MEDAVLGECHRNQVSASWPPHTRKIRHGTAGILIIMGLHNPYLRDHSIGVASFRMKLAQRLGFPSEQIALIRKASLLHDIGKLESLKLSLANRHSFFYLANVEKVKTTLPN